ncbi:MAG TPA: hypothetical protein VMF88_09175 [Bacteroidota bacterium]|nr:hypothetical protein [Bacteroidota bacterium]
MGTHNLFSRLGAMLIACALLLVASGEYSYASGTRAGTQITSNASATYHDQVGGGSYSASATALSIYVAYKPVSTITVVTSPQTGVDSSYVVYQLNVTNSGNYGDAYAVEFNSASTRYDSIGYYSNAGLTAALGGTAKNILRDTIPTDGNVNVYAKLYIKYDATFNSYDAQTIVGTFRSRSTRDVSADSGILISGSNYVPVGGAGQNATFNASGSTTTTIAQSIYSITASPLRGTVRPGDTLSFNIAYNNTGSAADTGVKIFVTYPANMTYSAQSSANWSNQGTYAVYSVGNVAATSGSISIANPLILSVTNSAALVEGTPTSLGSFGIIYKQNATNGLTQTRVKTPTFNTANYAFKAFANTRTAAAADTAIQAQAGDSITVKWIVKNNSNGSDAYTIKFVSASEGTWGAGYYYESNPQSGGTYTSGTDPRFNNAAYPSAQYVTTPTIARGTDTTIYIRTMVPSGLSGAVVHLVIQISSVRDSATVSGEAVGGTVTPLLPNIVVSRARVINPADSVGSGATVSVVPGGTVTYYIYVSNTGTGTASTVVITDNVSATGGYTNAPTSATINDGSDHVINPIPGGNAATYGSIATNGTGVVITINTLAPGGSRIIHYATTVQ